MADVNADGWLDIYICAVTNKLGLQGRMSFLSIIKMELLQKKQNNMDWECSAYSTRLYSLIMIETVISIVLF